MFIDRLRTTRHIVVCYFLLLLSIFATCRSEAANKILFLGLFDNDTTFQVWSISSDGTNIRRLTNSQYQITDLYQLNDPNHVAYSCESEIYLLDINSGESSLLVTREETNNKEELDIPYVSLSPDSSGIAITKKIAGKYYLRYLSLSNVVKSGILYDRAISAIVCVCWNRSDATTIYFLCDGVINKINITKKSLEQFTYAYNNIISFSISDDEKTSAINFFDKATNKSQVAIYNKDKLISVIASKYSSMDPHISRDGNILLYVDDYGLERNKLILYSILSKETRVILEDKGAIASPILY